MPDVTTTAQPPAQPLCAKPLAALLLEQIVNDAELRRLHCELREWVTRGVRPFDRDGSRAAIERLKRLAPGTPRLIRPAGYTTEKVSAAYATDPRTSHLNDHWAGVWAHRIRGRQSLVLARIFDRLRAGVDVATGRPCHNPIAMIPVPLDLWDAEATVLNTLTGDLSINTTPAFIDVMIMPPAPQPRSVSRSTLDRFARAFGEAMVAADRQFTLAELVTAVGQELGVTSDREIAEAIRRASPKAWAGAGRRPVAFTPTKDQLDAAARQAAEVAKTPA